LIARIFKRISNEDVDFMGFSSVFSRPEWMICETLAVPPPCVRPSVKHDAQQRSEDDLSHIIISIIKANQGLAEKIKQNAKENIIEDMTMFLQYNVATLVNNKIPGMDSVAQRSSGRLLKSITDRLNGKTGRIRGNLMGKRVDFSARSVITGDPNLSIRELGVPLKIAMNITYPARVHKRNIQYLTTLMKNGADKYPGAKVLQRQSGEQISLKYVDKNSISLRVGDILHRHMLDGDVVLFNRQPTLHRMSMMCHVVKIMYKGNTFRFNVADTKPYNADFDGDEMNMHMPQNPEAAAELRYLAAVPRHIISPASNSPIVGIFQDNLLGLFRFTRENITMTPKDAMNFLMNTSKIDPGKFKKKKVTNFEVMSQILPKMSTYMKNSLYDSGSEDSKTSNNIIDIVNGTMKRGQMNKGVSKILHSIYNDFGYNTCSDFIDDLQYIVTEYMKQSSYSVGVSDLMSDGETDKQIKHTIESNKKLVNDLHYQTLLGTFTNNSSNNNHIAYETKVNGILNTAREKAGTIGRKSLDKDNGFVIMVNAGSKGNNINIAQMISCLAQQNVDGKRIPYGFEDRTLPHFQKFDDSPEARGFVESSFIRGLNPEEFWFHAMGGREGLIDTAVKTAQTGYIQRRLIKGLEDLKVEYDMTVRNSFGKIVQYTYGGDNIDTTKVEQQPIPLVNMTLEDIYAHYQLPTESLEDELYTSTFTEKAFKRVKKSFDEYNKRIEQKVKYMVEMRDKIVKNVFNYDSNDKVFCPVNLKRVIGTIRNQMISKKNSRVDVTPIECLDMIEECKYELRDFKSCPATELFTLMMDFYLNPQDLLFKLRYTKKGLQMLCLSIQTYYKQAIVCPGEMVGMIAAQSIGEPTTQMSCTYNAVKKIVIVDKHKSIVHKTVKMGELCDQFIEKYPEYTFPTGHENSVETLLDKLDEQYYIVGVDKHEKTSWNRISHFSRHPVNGDLMTIKTKSGRKVTTTLSHSHLVRKEHQVQPIKGSDLSIGMRVPVCKHIDNTFVVDKVTIGKIEYILDHLFGWFIGAYLAEGNCSGNVICITNISQHYIDRTMAIATLFGCEGSIDNTPGQFGPATKTKFKHKELSRFLLNHCGTNSFTKKVPDFIFTAPNVCKSGVLQGYMDGDGNINCDERHHEIRGCSRSERLIKDLCLLFNYFDIFTTTSENKRQEKPLYHFAITASYAGQYKNQIGSVVKEDKLQALCDYISRDNVHSVSNDVDKIEGLGDIIATCGKVLELPGQSRNYDRWKKKGSIGRRTLQKYIQIFKDAIQDQGRDILKEEMAILEQAANSHIVWDEIVEIEFYTPPQDEYVYDFTVPKDQTFMEDSGIFVHNTLNTFHFAGVSSKSNATRGVPRIEEILSLSKSPKSESVTIYLKDKEQESTARSQQIQYIVENTTLRDIVLSSSICFDPDELNTLIECDMQLMEQYKRFEQMMEECVKSSSSGTQKKNKKGKKGKKKKKDKEKHTEDENDNSENEDEDDEENLDTESESSKYIIRFELNKEVMLDKNITMEEVHYAIANGYQDEVECVFSDYNEDKLVFRIRLKEILSKKKGLAYNDQQTLDQSNEIYLLKNIESHLLDNINLKGVKNIKNVHLRKLAHQMIKEDTKYVKKDVWVLDTVGTNLLDILGMNMIDQKRTYSNSIMEMYEVLGIEAARESIYREIHEVLDFGGSYINSHHIELLCDRMCMSAKLISMYRHGINNDDIGPIAKGSFEETTEMFLRAARHAEFDRMRGVSANIMCGQNGNYGTSAFKVLIDMEQMRKYPPKPMPDKKETLSMSDIYNNLEMENPSDKCSINNLLIDNQHQYIQTSNVIHSEQSNQDVNANNSNNDDDYNPGF
jgi:DNA-directed RNA polymerase beta' subunit